jgi:hypothetical protein
VTAQHTPGPLSGTQKSALEWIKANGPAERGAYRAAGFTAKTIGSLMNRGLVYRKQETEPRWRFVYIAKDTGQEGSAA